MAQPLPALFHSRWSAPEVPGCKSPVLQGSMCVISTWNRETHPQERWCEHNSTAPSPGAHGNVPLPNNPSTSRVMACKEELGAETRVILKPTFTWEARKEALESLSLRSVVFSPSPTLHIMLTARPRLHQENSAACSKFCLPGLPGDLFHQPLQRHQACLPCAEEWAWSLRTWWENRQHGDSARKLDFWARFITREQLRQTRWRQQSCGRTSSLLKAWWTKAPSLDAFWLHSCWGLEPVSGRPQSRCKLGILSPLAQKGGAFTLHLTAWFKAISASAFLPSFLFRIVCWSLTRSYDMLFY